MSDAPFSPDTTASEPTTVSQRAWGGKLPRAADFYEARHNGTPEAGRRAMLARTGCESMKELIAKIVPEGIRRGAFAAVPEAAGEGAALAELRKIAEENRPGRAFIGQGFYGTRMPPVIQRNVFESPGWLTAYTPYQAEISQGRLELLLGFQTLAAELTGLPAANASMLDEATAAAEAMALCFRTRADAAARVFFVSEGCHPQTVAVVRTRARPMGVEVVVGDEETFEVTAACFGGLAQYPDTRGDVKDFTGFFGRLRAVGAKAVVAADPLALVLLRPPGEFGADIAVGSAQRFGMHLGFGGPAAAFFAAKEGLRRQLPGRLVGISRDAAGREALRLALGTREQHIRRDKATSNICTAQALPAMLSTLFAEWHGPEGLRAIARRVKLLTDSLREGLRQLGFPVNAGPVFDTVTVETVDAEAVHARAEAAGMVFRRAGERLVGV
ncbi:MAG: glycine dehydrogenase (aminomethyl-transferring), partial [Opitutaceae bacterium]|nr:glycine dehydrogenase (aminomethyl-transferring) [Opitutaceae bacterium]